jgi:inhibitor of KinA sporulation pathway (predicted exonuclease)
MNYIIFDLEATCWENDRSIENEIIEIGAVKLNDKLDIIDEFSIFVRPTTNPVLSEFCTRLTSITQKNVDEAETFDKVLPDFENWIIESSNEVIIYSWGFYDKKQLLKECNTKQYFGSILNLLDNHVSLKHKFAEIRQIKPCGMEYALRLLKLPLEGTHHRGIDDAKNITKIFKVVFNELK